MWKLRRTRRPSWTGKLMLFSALLALILSPGCSAPPEKPPKDARAGLTLPRPIALTTTSGRPERVRRTSEEPDIFEVSKEGDRVVLLWSDLRAILAELQALRAWQKTALDLVDSRRGEGR